jgi:hypothetical protein
MSKAYPSNLTRDQYEFLSDWLPEAKSGGRPRSVELWEVGQALGINFDIPRLLKHPLIHFIRRYSPFH